MPIWQGWWCLVHHDVIIQPWGPFQCHYRCSGQWEMATTSRTLSGVLYKGFGSVRLFRECPRGPLEDTSTKTTIDTHCAICFKGCLKRYFQAAASRLNNFSHMIGWGSLEADGLRKSFTILVAPQTHEWLNPYMWKWEDIVLNSWLHSIFGRHSTLKVKLSRALSSHYLELYPHIGLGSP